MAGIVDISFESDVSQSLKDLEKLKKQLEEIDKLRSGKIKVDISELQKAEQEVTNEKKKQNKIRAEDRVKAEKEAQTVIDSIKSKSKNSGSKEEVENTKKAYLQLLDMMRLADKSLYSGLEKSMSMIQQYMEQLKQGIPLNAEQLKLLQTRMAIETNLVNIQKEAGNVQRKNYEQALKTQKEIQGSYLKMNIDQNIVSGGLSGKSAKGSASVFEEGFKKEELLTKQLLDLDLKRFNANKANATESLNLVKQYENQLKNNIPLSQTQLKELNNILTIEKSIVSEEEKKNKLFLDNLSKLEIQKNLIQGSNVSEQNKANLLKSLSSLEKNLMDENFSHAVNLEKQKFTEALKYEKDFSTLKKIEMDKSYSIENVADRISKSNLIEESKKIELINKLSTIEKEKEDENFKYRIKNLEKIISEEERLSKESQKLTKISEDRSYKIKELQDFINKTSKIETDSKEKLLSDLSNLEKNKMNSDFSYKLNSIKTQLGEEKKLFEQQSKEQQVKKERVYDIGKLKAELDANKLLTVNSKEDLLKQLEILEKNATDKDYKIKIDAIKTRISTETKLEQENINNKKKIEQQEISNKKLLEDTKLILLRNGAKGALKLEFDVLSQRKDITRQEIDDFRSKLKEKLAIRQGVAKQEAMGAAQLMLGQMVTQDLKSNIAEMARFEETIYGIGIVGKKSLPEIMNLRNEMFDLGRVIPRMTQDIADNIITIQRTGKSYEEAMTIIKNSSMLAVAGQESIKNATDVLNKVLVAFNIEAENSTAAMNSLHTATINTPLDLHKIDESLRNAGAGMRNFIESTDKSGVALEEYKQRILDTTLSLVGGMTSMGMTASSAGVAVRNLGTKMLVMEKTAGMMFDKDVAEYFYDIEASGNRASDGLNKAGKGVRLTNEYLSELAQKDAPKAIELLSELYKRGDLGLRTISKMMTMRQAPAIISQLGLINGNMDDFIKRQTTGSDIQLDYNKALESWTNQLELAKNNMFALQGATSGYMQYVGKTGLSIFNKSIKALDEMIDKNTTLGHFLGVVKDAFIAMAMAGTMALGVKTIANISGMTEALTKFMTTLKLTTSMLSYIGLVIGAITIGVSAYNRYQEHQAMILENQRKLNAEYLKSKKALSDSNILLQAQQKMFTELTTMDLSKEIKNSYDLMSAMVEKTSELVKLLGLAKEINAFKFPELKNSIALQKELTNTIEEAMKKYNSEILNEETGAFGTKNTNPNLIGMNYYKEQIKLLKEYKEILESTDKILIGENTTEELKKRLQSEYFMFEIYKETKKPDKAINYINKEILKAEENLFVVKTKYTEKAKSLYGEDFKYYQINELKKLNISKGMSEQQKKIIESSVPTRGRTEYARGIQQEEIAKNIQMVEEFKNKYAGKSYFEAFSDVDIETGKKIIEILGLTQEQQTILNNILEERQKIETQNLETMNMAYGKLFETFQSFNSSIQDMNLSSLEMLLGQKGVKTITEAEKVIEDFGYSIDENLIKTLKDLEKQSDGKIKLDVIVESGKLIESLALIKTTSESISLLKSKISDIQKKGEGMTLGGIAGNNTKLRAEFLNAYNKANPKETVSTFEEIADKQANIVNYTEIINGLEKELQDMQGKRLRAVSEVADKKKEEKQLTLDIFNIYDKNQILLLEKQKAQATGIRLLQVEKQLIDENYKLEMKKNAYNVKNMTEELGFGTTEGKDLEGLLNFEKQRLEIKNKNNTLTEEDTKRYKTIKELMETIQKSTEDENKYKIQSYENTEKQKKAIEEINKYGKENIKTLYDAIYPEDERLQSIKDRIKLQALENENILSSIYNEIKANEKLKNVSLDSIQNMNEEELNSLNLSEEQKKKITDLVEKYKELVGLRKTIKSDDEKIAEITKQTQDLSKDEYSLLEESIEVNKDKKAKLDEQNKTGKLTIEQKQLEYQIEKDMLDLQVKRNNATIQNINSAMSLLDKIAGTNISGLTSDITGLFNQNAQGKNTFDIAGTATQGLDVANVGAILGIAGAGYTTVTTAINMVQAADEKHNASQLEKWNKQLELSQKQLSAIESMRDTLSQYQNKLVDDLSKMPTFQNLNKVMPTYDIITKALIDGSKFLTDEVTLKYTFKSEGEFLGISWNKLDRTKTETKTISLKDLLGVDIKGLSLEQMKEYLNVLEIIEKLDLKSEDIGKQIQDAFNLPGDIIEGVTDITSGLTTLTTFLTGMGNPIGIVLGEAINAIFGGDFELENIQSNFDEVIDSFEKYISALEMVKSNVDSLMTTATLKSFKGVVVNDIESAKKEYRKMAESILEPLKTGFYEQGAKAGKTTEVLDVEWESEVQNMTDNFMKGFEEISVTAGVTIREGIIEGVDSSLKALGNIMQEAMYNVSSVLTDVIYGENLENINKFTKDFNTSITKLKKEYENDPFKLKVKINEESDKYVANMLDEWGEIEKKGNQKVDIINKFITGATEKGYDLVEIATTWGLSLEDIGMTNEEIWEGYKDGKYTIEQVLALSGSWVETQKSLRQFNMDNREILVDNLETSKKIYEEDRNNSEKYLKYLQDKKALEDYDKNIQEQINDFEYTRGEILYKNYNTSKLIYKEDETNATNKLKFYQDEKAYLEYKNNIEKETRQLYMTEGQILKDNADIAYKAYLADYKNEEKKLEYQKANKALKDYERNINKELNQLYMTEGQILKDNYYIAYKAYAADIFNEDKKLEYEKANKALNDYDLNIQKELNQLGMTEGEILKDNYETAYKAWELDKSNKDNQLKLAQSEKALNEWRQANVEATQEANRQLGLVYANEEAIELSNNRQLKIKLEKAKLIKDAEERERAIAEATLEIEQSEKSLLELAKSREVVNNAIKDTMLEVNFFTQEQAEIYDAIGSSISGNIRNTLKGKVIEAKYEGRIQEIKALTSEITQLSLEAEKAKSKELERQGNIESINNKKRLLFMKGEDLESRYAEGKITSEDYAKESAQLISEFNLLSDTVRELGGEVKITASDVVFDWSNAINEDNFKEKIREKGEALKELIKKFATDLKNDDILRLIDEMFGEQAWQTAVEAGKDGVDKFISNYQRLSNALRDSQRAISDFTLKYDEQRLTKQKEYLQQQAIELENERVMFGYNESKLNQLKAEHASQIEQFKIQGKINELGEIDFGTNEQLKEQYDNRLSLIEKIESLLTEQSQTQLDILNNEKELNNLYIDRQTQYDDMQKSLFDNEQSLIDAYLQYTNIGKTQDEIDKSNIERLKVKKELIEEQLGYSESQIRLLYEQITSTDELGRTIKDKSKISGAEFEILQETNNLTNEQIDLLKEWLSVSGDILNSNKEINNDLKDGLISAFKESLNQANYEDGVSVLSDFFSENITDSIIDGLVNAKFKSQIENLYGSLYTTMAGGFNLGAIQQANASIQRIQLEAEIERNRLNVLKDMLNFKSNIDYSATQNKIQYSTGSNSTNTYVTNLNTNVSSLITTDKASTNKFAQEIVDGILVALNDKGYNMDKIKK